MYERGSEQRCDQTGVAAIELQPVHGRYQVSRLHALSQASCYCV
jgi:hypothetical protein